MSRIIFLQCGCSHYYAILWLCKRIHCVKIGLHFCIIQSAFFFRLIREGGQTGSLKREKNEPVKLRKQSVTYVQQWF